MNEIKKEMVMQDLICGLYYKILRIVIYNRNDTMIVEPVL